jgi:hypothetical protein
LAHTNRIVPLPDVWWQSDTNADSDADTYTNSNADTDSDAYSNADACACAECAEQSRWKRRFHDSDQSVVDG